MHPSEKKKEHVKFTSYEMARHLSHLSRSLELHEFVILFRPGFSLGEIVNGQTQAARLGIPRSPPLQSLLCPSLTFCTDRRAYSVVITQYFSNR